MVGKHMMNPTNQLTFRDNELRLVVVLSGMSVIALIDFIQKSIIVMPFYWAIIMVSATFVKWRYTVWLSMIALFLSIMAGREWGYLTSSDYLVRLAMGVVLSVIAAFLSREIEARDDRLMSLSFSDPLTELPNRILLYERLNSRLRQRDPVNPIVVAFIDLDDFKSVNDQYGHDAGDAMLKETGRRLTEIVRKEDTAARLGGDEFVIFCNSIEDKSGAEALCERLSDAMKQPFRFGETEVVRSGSIGCLVTNRSDLDAEGLIKLADQALFETKASAKGGYRIVDLVGTSNS